MDLRSTPEAMAKVTPWVVWANAALDPILFLENDRGQVIGTRLTQNPRQIQVRASSPTLSFTPFLTPQPPAPRPHPSICIFRSLARSLARSHLFLALSLSRSLALSLSRSLSRSSLPPCVCVCVWQVLEKLLGDGREWLCGDRFSVADVAVASYLLYMPQVLHFVFGTTLFLLTVASYLLYVQFFFGTTLFSVGGCRLPPIHASGSFFFGRC
jgi:hypothetical protein